MPVYRVEMQGECREVYLVEADSEEDAGSNWAQGCLVVQESIGMDLYSVTLEEE